MKKATKFNLRRLTDFIKVFGRNVRAVCPKNGVFKTKLDELWLCNKKLRSLQSNCRVLFLYLDSHPFNTSASR